MIEYFFFKKKKHKANFLTYRANDFFYFDKSCFSISFGYPVEYQKTVEDQPFLWLLLVEIP